MADPQWQARPSKAKQSKKQNTEASLPLPDSCPSTSGLQTSRDKGHRHSSRGRSDTAKSSKVTERDESRRDKALQKICERSARVTQSEPDLASLSTMRPLQGGSSRDDQGDNISLDSPNLALADNDIWGPVECHWNRDAGRGQSTSLPLATFTPLQWGSDLRPLKAHWMLRACRL